LEVLDPGSATVINYASCELDLEKKKHFYIYFFITHLHGSRDIQSISILYLFYKKNIKNNRLNKGEYARKNGYRGTLEK
jgi:hypothetical protein